MTPHTYECTRVGRSVSTMWLDTAQGLGTTNGEKRQAKKEGTSLFTMPPPPAQR